MDRGGGRVRGQGRSEGERTGEEEEGRSMSKRSRAREEGRKGED